MCFGVQKTPMMRAALRWPEAGAYGDESLMGQRVEIMCLYSPSLLSMGSLVAKSERTTWLDVIYLGSVLRNGE